MNYDIVICGIGGQGVMLISRVIAEAALKEGEKVMVMEDRGHAKRFGSISCHIRLGDAYSPTIPEGSADLLVGLDPTEAVRNLHYLKKGSTAIIDSTSASIDGIAEFTIYQAAPLVNDKNVRFYTVDTTGISNTIGSQLVRNMAMLGAITAVECFPLGKNIVKRSMKTLVPKKIKENEKAFELSHKQIKNAR
ncbi:MAG: 2-oxoacid:acceptor oxidoreductase family protein [Candidatus Altiarchaeota archaeon]